MVTSTPRSSFSLSAERRSGVTSAMSTPMYAPVLSSSPAKPVSQDHNRDSRAPALWSGIGLAEAGKGWRGREPGAQQRWVGAYGPPDLRSDRWFGTGVYARPRFFQRLARRNLMSPVVVRTLRVGPPPFSLPSALKLF